MLNTESHAYMIRWMDPTQHEHIYDETKADVAWIKLENHFSEKKNQKIKLL